MSEHEEVPPVEGQPEQEQGTEEADAPAVEAGETKEPCETDVLKAVMAKVDQMDGYMMTKGSTQELKELLVREPMRIATVASQLKAKAKGVNDSIDARKKDQNDYKNQMDQIKAETEALRNDNAADRAEKKKVQLAEEQEKKKRFQEVVEQAQNDGRKPFQSTDLGSRYITFLTTRGDHLMKAEVMKARYTQLNEAKVSKRADTDALLDVLRTDEQSLIRLGLELDKLQTLAVELRADGWEHDLDIEQLRELLEEAKTQHSAWKLAVHSEVKYQAELKKRIETFMEEQESLLTWIGNQQQNLSLLTKPGDIVEFCTSLHELVNTMEENITVLQDMSEAHLPNETITSALVELSTAWFKLNVMSYEMLTKTLVEQHTQSGVRESVAAFAEWQRGDLKQLLDDAEDLLQTPENPREKDLVASALELCKELQKEFQPHLLLMDHLADFEVRMELIEDQYLPMLSTTRSNVTNLCQKLRFSIPPSWHGKKEYEQQMNYLNDWSEARDTDTTAWEIAKGKVSKLCVTLDLQ